MTAKDRSATLTRRDGDGTARTSGPGEVITLDDGTRVRLVGQLELVPVAGGVRPVRLPTASWAHFPPDSALLRGVVEQASGVRLTVRTSATHLMLSVRCTRIQIEDWTAPINSFVVQVDGEHAGAYATPVDRVARFPLVGDVIDVTTQSERSAVDISPLPARDKEVVIWFPQGVIVDVLGLEGNAPIHPGTEAQRPVWIHHGSSISHCADPAEPTSSWPVVAAQAAGLELVNLGFSGQCMLDPFVADAIATTDADVISLKVGINIVGARAMDRRTFVPAMHGFLDRIRTGHPDTPIVLSSSILWAGNENVPGPAGVEMLGEGHTRSFAIGDRGDVAKGALTLATSRDHLRHVVAAVS